MFNDNIIDVKECDVQFNAMHLRFELGLLLTKFAWHESAGQLNLMHTGKFTDPADQIYDGVGSLIKPRSLDREYIVGKTRDQFTHLHDAVKGTYFETVINRVSSISTRPISRTRLMMLRAKTCYSWHKDDDTVRYHIPIITNPRCFIVTEHGLYTMPTVGKLYSLVTTAMHTAMNASFEDRVHLLIDTQ